MDLGNKKIVYLATVMVVSAALLLFGTAGLALEEESVGTQTSSEQIGEGAIEVIGGVLEDNDVQSDSELLEQAKSMIEGGVPEGTVVAVVKSLNTGHLDGTDELESVFSDLEENVAEDDLPPGLVIRSVKTTYDLPETVEPPYGNGSENGSPTEEARSESEESEKDGRPENAGPPDEDDEKGPPEERGKSGKSENSEDRAAVRDDRSEDKGEGKPDDAGPPENKRGADEKGPPDEEDSSDKGVGPPDDKGK